MDYNFLFFSIFKINNTNSHFRSTYTYIKCYVSKQKGFTNTIVKNVLEHIARHRTVDIRKQQYNKVDVLGRTYRTILEPLCYITGRIKLWKKK